MNRLYALIGVYWVAMTLVSLVMIIYRQPVAGWFRPRMRYWRNRPDAQRLYERSVLLGGIGLGAFCVILLYVHFVLIPSLELTLTHIRSANVELQRQTGCPDPI
jgi:hypothetical protein